VAVDADSIRIAADYQGARHLYVRRVAAPLELTITDEPMTFAGSLPIDYDVARLVPLMKFVPPPLSIVRGADRLPPGTFCVYERPTLASTVRQSYLRDLYRVATSTASREEVRQTLLAIVADQARSLSCPVVFLSGGSDSALLVHLLKSSGALPATWTAVFDSSTGRSEAKLAAAAAAHYGAPWRAVTIDKAGMWEHLPIILGHMTEPFADAALVPEAVLGLVMRQQWAAPLGRIAVFEGEGMDSLMCGSYKFLAERYRRWLAPALMAVPAAALRGVGRGSSWGAFKLKMQQLKSLLQGKEEVFQRHLGFLQDDDLGDYVPSAIRTTVGQAFRSGYDLLPEVDELNRLAMMTFQGNVPNLENRKLQVVSACADIDFHLTYQDPRFIRLAMSIPTRAKIAKGYGKWIVKEAFRRDLPPHALTRRKASFVPPIVDWIWPEGEELLLSSELFEPGEIHRRIRQHIDGRRDHLGFLWGLLVTNAWIRRYEQEATARRTEKDTRQAAPGQATTATSIC
jgi:asparagine synthase (glutamine-hydrolysing)